MFRISNTLTDFMREGRELDVKGVMSVAGLLMEMACRLRRYRKLTIGLSVASLIDLGYQTLLPVSLKYIMDDGLLQRNWLLLVQLLVALTVGLSLVCGFSLARDVWVVRLGTSILNDLRREIFDKIQRLSSAFFLRTPQGDLLTRYTSDLAAIESAVTVYMPAFGVSALGLVLQGSLLFTLDWRLALVAIVGMALGIFGVRRLEPVASSAQYQLRQQQALSTAMLQEQINAHLEMRLFGQQSAARDRFVAALDEVLSRSMRAGLLGALLGRVPHLSIQLLNLVIIAAGAVLVYRGEMSIGSIVAFNALFAGMSNYMAGLTWVMPRLVESATGMHRIREILLEPIELDDLPNARSMPPPSRSLDLYSVTLEYATGRRALDNVTLSIPVGAYTAIVGPSGSGKSSLVSLLLRQYDPTFGSVQVDGVDLREYTRESLYAAIGVVPQETVLFNSTIRENIRYGLLGATDAQVEQAARMAGLHASIETMPEGYDTPVGEHGGRLSGGQRQRVAIARALLRDPGILVLDEATAALDAATETAIFDTLEQLRTGRTIVVITHRLAPVRMADHIHVLDEGRLVESGRHDDLMQRDGLYASLWNKQHAFTFAADGSIQMPVLRPLGPGATAEERFLREATALLVVENIPAGQQLIAAGDVPDRMYMLARGRVAVQPETGPPTILEDGDHFGELELLGGLPYRQTLTAITPCVCLTLSRNAFFHLLQRMPQLRAGMEAALRAYRQQ